MHLGTFLFHIQLQQYQEVLVRQGFGSWQELILITEEDLEELGFKLGHRRKLQRAIAKCQGKPNWEPLLCSLPGDSYFCDFQGPKRRYHRRPPKDLHAPRRPRSGYVLFSNFLRQNPLVNELPFTQIAKLVGEKWTQLLPEERQMWVSHAEEQKVIYRMELLSYQQTEDYQRHRSNICAFKKNECSRTRRPSQTSTNGSTISSDCTDEISMSPEISTCTSPRKDSVDSESTSWSLPIFEAIPGLSQSTTSHTSLQVPCESPQTDSCHHILESNWQSVSHENPYNFPPNPVNVDDTILALRLGQNNEEFRKSYLRDHSPFDAESAIHVRQMLNLFIQRVNAFYHLVDAEYLVHHLHLATETNEILSDYSMYILCFCISIGFQIFHEGKEEMALVWHEYGRRYLENNDCGTVSDIMQALVLISIFHMNLRPATAQWYIGTALQIDRNNITLEHTESGSL